MDEDCVGHDLGCEDCKASDSSSVTSTSSAKEPEEGTESLPADDLSADIRTESKAAD